MKALWLSKTFLLLAFAVQSGQTSFTELSAAAESARLSNDLPNAVGLYHRALEANPKWKEGWWWLGSILYDMNRYAEAISSLKHLEELDAKAATGIGLLGLCEFEGGEYTASLLHISRSLEVGLDGQDQMEGVLRYHEALLLAHNGEFDSALRKYGWFVQKGVHHTVMLTALGLAALHNTQFPEAVSEGQRDVFVAAGNASYLSMTGAPEALQSFHELAERYSSVPFVHYLYAQILIPLDPSAAISELRRELATAPNNGEACAMLSWLDMEENDFSEALPLAERAFRLAPEFSMTSYVYGRALVQKDDLKKGISHLEIAVKNAPSRLVCHTALAAAYARAGRVADARRERSVSMQLAHEELATTRP